MCDDTSNTNVPLNLASHLTSLFDGRDKRNMKSANVTNTMNSRSIQTGLPSFADQLLFTINFALCANISALELNAT